MLVSEVMTEAPVVAEATATVHEVIDILMSMEPRHLPIVQKGVLFGVLCDRDLRPFMRPAVVAGERAAEVAALKQPISSILKSDFPSVSADTEVRDVARAMIHLRLEALPVVEPHTRRLVGMVSYVDVLKLALRFL